MKLAASVLPSGRGGEP